MNELMDNWLYFEIEQTIPHQKHLNPMIYTIFTLLALKLHAHCRLNSVTETDTCLLNIFIFSGQYNTLGDSAANIVKQYNLLKDCHA